jgi:hypothetical protein
MRAARDRVRHEGLDLRVRIARKRRGLDSWEEAELELPFTYLGDCCAQKSKACASGLL